MPLLRLALVAGAAWESSCAPSAAPSALPISAPSLSMLMPSANPDWSSPPDTAIASPATLHLTAQNSTPSSSPVLLPRSTVRSTPLPSRECETDGFTCNPSVSACPDGGKLQAAAGGLVFVTILRAVGLPDEDGSVVPDVFGLTKRSDPFVKVEAGRASASTRPKNNALRATWNERLQLGYLRSGAKLRFKVKDRDVGIERLDGKNDALGGADMRVPYCTAFSAAPMSSVQNDGLPAATSESPWAMGSNRLLCRERGWLRLGDKGKSMTYSAAESRQACCVGRSAPCLEVVVEIEPFQLYVDRKFGKPYQGDEYLSFMVLSGDHNVTSIHPEGYESLFLDGPPARPAATTSTALRGALAFRTYRADFEVLEPGSLYARLSTNHRAKLSLCVNATGEARDCFSNLGFKAAPYYLPLDNGDTFTCWSKTIGHATRNRYGYVTGGDAIVLYLSWICPEFFGVLEPLPSSQAHNRQFRPPVRLDGYVLATRFYHFAIAFLTSGIPALRLTRACDFRFEKIGAAATGVLDPTLFGSCGGLSFAARSLLGREDVARRYYWLTRATQAACAIPCMLFVSFGFSTVVSVDPKLLGWAWVLAGGATVMAAYAGSVWNAACWRLTPAPVASLALAALFVFIFSLVAVGVSPCGKVDFTALTCACLTATLAVLALETVERNDRLLEAKRALQMALRLVLQDSTEHWMLSEGYTACSDASAFDFVGDVTGDACGFANRADTHRAAIHRRLIMHVVRIIILVIYVAYASAKTGLGVIALVNVLAISLTDSVHPLLARSQLFWSPKKVVGLASLGRLALATCGPRRWIVGHSILFVVYGLPLSEEIVARHFPHLSRLEAAAVVFLQRAGPRRASDDLAGRPEFILAANASSLFVFVLGAGFITPHALPITPSGQLLGYVFPVCAAFAVAASAFASVGLRAARCETTTYFCDPRCSTAYAYALLVTWLVFCVGLFLWVVTGTAAVLVAVLSAFACLASSSYAFQTWLDNDCRALVYWPPPNHDTAARADNGTPLNDQDLALGAIKSMMFDEKSTQGNQTDDIRNNEQPTTLENFKFPQFERIDWNDAQVIAAIDMPVLPQLDASLNQKHKKLKSAKVSPLQPLEAAQKQLSEDGSAPPVFATRSSPFQFSRRLRGEDQKRTLIIDLGLVELRRRKKRRKSARHNASETAGESDYTAPLTTREVATQVARYVAARLQSRNKCRPSHSVAKVQVSEESRALHGKQSDLEPTSVPATAEEMPFWEAWLSGGLTTREKLAVYAALVSPLTLLIFGCALSWASRPKVMGHLVWTSTIALAGLGLPVVKYIHARHDITTDSVGILWIAVGAIFWWSTLALAFFRLANSRFDNLVAMLLLDLLLLSPAMYFASALAAIWWFHDDAVAGDAQGALARRLILRLARCYRSKETADNVDAEFASVFGSRKMRCRGAMLAMVMLVLTSTQILLWGSLRAAIIWIFICLGGLEWVQLALPTECDIVLPARLEAVDSRLKVVVSLSLVFFFAGAPKYTATAATLCFLPVIFHFATRLVFEDRPLIVNRALWTSRVCLPAFSYASGDRTVKDTTRPAARLAAVLLVVFAWGATLAALVIPTSIGVGIVCAAATAAIWLAVTASSRVILALGLAADFLSPSIFRDAAHSARLALEEAMRAKLSAPLLGSTKLIDGCARREGYEDELRYESPEQRMAQSDVKSALVLASWLKRNSQFEGHNGDDALLEMLRGDGPLGFLGFFLPRSYLRRSRQAIDNSAASLSLSRKREMLVELCEAERRFEARFESEIKCCANFQLLVMCATEAQLAYEQHLFRNFVAESKFRLAANGIYPPVFLRDNSDDVHMIAFWLLEILDGEKRRRFHYLQSKFRRNSEQRETAAGEVEKAEAARADAAARCRKNRELAYILRQATAVEKSKRIRLEAWLSSAEVFVTMDPATAALARGLFLSNDEASALAALSYIGSSEDIVEAYTREVSTSCAAVTTCLENVAEIEAEERDCFYIKGTSGAELRYLDPEFPANANSVGHCRGSSAVGVRWASKFGTPLVNLKAQPFVSEGVAVADAWLVDAIGVLAAHDKRLLISTLLLNDKTKVGVIAVKLFVDGTWATIIVDEYFPVLGSKTNDEESGALALTRVRKAPDHVNSLFNASPPNLDRRDEDERRLEARDLAVYHETRGVAVAHVPHLSELWVSVVEKAAAKLYGSYEAIEYGSLDHGLTMLTGCACDRIYLNQAKQGVNRIELWSRLVAAKRRGYALAATTVSPARASPYARELGLALDATYAIIGLRDAGPQRKLLELRATRVEHTFATNARRKQRTYGIRHKLELSDATSCWFEFGDACCAFHVLYVCQRHSGRRWRSWTKSAAWRKKKVVDLDNGRRVELEGTSPGLPSRFNLTCAVECNPQFSLRIFQPTNLHLRLDQVDAAGRRATTLLPVAAFLCRAVEPHRVVSLNDSNVLAHTGDPNPRPTLFLDVDDLEPAWYVLLCGTYHPGLSGPFTLTVTGDQNVQFDQLWPPVVRPAIEDSGALE